MFSTEIINKFQNVQTPFYYYDSALLQQTLGALRAATANESHVNVHYAIKANAHPTVLRTIAAAGFGADCVSGGEIRAAIEAGFPANKIVFAGVGKQDWEIKLGIELGIACFNVESNPELDRINELAQEAGKKARVAFRINPDVDAHTHANITTGLRENKFGIAMTDMITAIRTAKGLDNVTYVGLHFHIGSQITEFEPFEALSNRINELQDKLEAEGIRTESINVGGGLGVDYKKPSENPLPDFNGYFATFRKALKLRPYQTLHFELGRAVVAQCGSLITRVIFVKHAQVKQFAIVDAGFTDLIRPALYGAHHKIENITSEEPKQMYDVVGPICESSDVFDKNIRLCACRRGDLLAIRSGGAYGEVMASGYNCRPVVKGYMTEEL